MKKLLPVAVLSALAGVNGANAVTVNPHGLGEVLLYPFYTTEGGQDTLINLVNTTSEIVAVKVRILESMNSQEVLDFNLYLSPFDHWSAAIIADAGGGAAIISGDLSCTVPNAVNEGQQIPFRNFEYQTDEINKGVDRTKEGYIEVIEMGILDSTDTTNASLIAAITHIGGIPGGGSNPPVDCTTVAAAWNAGGKWALSQNDGMLEPQGGLYGYGVLIDVAEGTDTSYDATALAQFSQSPLHTNPGSLSPSLNDANPPVAFAPDPFASLGGFLDVTPNGPAATAIDAVSAVLMSESIANDFVLEQAISAGTDWVITFPTKRDYVNVLDPNDIKPPFTSQWDIETTTACEAIGITYYDREEQGVTPSGLDFSPAPPGPAAFALCAEANVMTFNTSNVLEASARTGVDLSVIHENGWLSIDYGIAPPAAAAGARRLATVDGDLKGLPSIGFGVQKYVNGDLGGLLSNYAGSVVHKKTVSFD